MEIPQLELPPAPSGTRLQAYADVTATVNLMVNLCLRITERKMISFFTNSGNQKMLIVARLGISLNLGLKRGVALFHQK